MLVSNKDVLSCRQLLVYFIVTLIAAIAATGQTPTKSFEVSGVVLDPSRASIAGATVILRAEGRTPETTTANEKGEFHFSRVASGVYQIETLKDGFKSITTQLKIEARTPSRLEIVLPIADVHEEIAVGDKANQVNTNPESNLDVIKLDRAELKNLPVLGNDIVGTLANLLDASSIGAGGASVLVDGLETTKRVRAATIKEVRINQNPYSAEFARPGRGRIEVITKPGEPEFHGEFSFIFRDSSTGCTKRLRDRSAARATPNLREFSDRAHRPRRENNVLLQRRARRGGSPIGSLCQHARRRCQPERRHS